MRVEPKDLVKRLTPTASQALQSAAGRAVSSQHPEITVEHLLLALLSTDGGEVPMVLQELNVDVKALTNRVEKVVAAMKAGHGGRPVFSQSVFSWIEDTLLGALVMRGEVRVRSGALLSQLAAKPSRYLDGSYAEIDGLDPSAVNRAVDGLVSREAIEALPEGGDGKPVAGSSPAAPGGKDSALGRFATNFTEDARKGKIDPVLGRHREVRQMIDILCRRRKNNPILVGEPGVGKTALVEGLALAIVKGDVPDKLKGVELYGLDIGSLQAGASVKGELENRLKQVIAEVKASPKPIVLFIDEAHTLIGAGGPVGGGDLANLLKPALARGELRTIAATTWAEYKKYFEKDAALERRFQPVKVDEPDVDTAIGMLRGLRDVYERAHGVVIRDEAIEAAARLSHRYVSGRQLPDKAVDLLDTSAARVRVEQSGTPEIVTTIEAEIAADERERAALVRELEHGVDDRAGVEERLAGIVARLASARDRRESMLARYQVERAAVEALIAARTGYEAAVAASPEGAKSDAVVEARKKVDEAAAKLAAIPPTDRLLRAEVDAEAVARTISAWTGIPVGKMQRDAASSVLSLEEKLRERVIGQDVALQSVAETLRIAHAGIRDPNAPVGVLLFVGPSGVGKTETALALADLMYGGERFLTTINMSEHQEKHSVSRLVGSPPGYVGYGEGGVLTEAVRQRPYSVVLLDECEKADLEVMNIFYQVFDKGVLNDGEGRPIDFKNTLIVLTSNLASDLVMQCFDDEEPPKAEDVVAVIRPTLSAHFQPALLARMAIVPFAPIGESAMGRIARLKLGKIAKRIEATHDLRVEIDDALIETVAKRCTESETGARNVDHMLRSGILPKVATTLLEHMAADRDADVLRLGVDSNGDYLVEIGNSAAQPGTVPAEA